MGKVTVEDGDKTVYRYDASARTFKKAALFLFTLAAGMIVVAFIWFFNFMGLQ
jgi:hypothetical protein